mgnify:CR=1 FL=1
MITQGQRGELVQRALEARKHAYAPYSHYAVGAALLGENGTVYSGANVENAAYPNGTCAERSALFHAVSEGERAFSAIAVLTTCLLHVQRPRRGVGTVTSSP